MKNRFVAIRLWIALFSSIFFLSLIAFPSIAVHAQIPDPGYFF